MRERKKTEFMFVSYVTSVPWYMMDLKGGTGYWKMRDDRRAVKKKMKKDKKKKRKKN